MLHRVARAIRAGRQAAAGGNAPPAAGTGAAWALVHLGAAAGPEVGLAAHRAFCARRGYRCLVVSDRIPAECIGAGGPVFEFVPWPLQPEEAPPGGFAAALDYSFRRLGLIFAFWRVAGCRWSGPGSTELLELAPPDAHPLVRIARPAAAAGRQAFTDPAVHARLAG